MDNQIQELNRQISHAQSKVKSIEDKLHEAINEGDEVMIAHLSAKVSYYEGQRSGLQMALNILAPRQ